MPDETLILDGTVRDRCPYVGDLAVTGLTLLDAGRDPGPLRNMILLFARLQRANGAIPASPLVHGPGVLIDYPAYWVEVVYDYALHTGDLGLVRQVWPNLVRVLDVYYPSGIDRGGLLSSRIGDGDYAFIRRRGPYVAYYNAQYLRALQFGVALAGWIGDAARARAWGAQASALATRIAAAFWDPSVGAFRDTTTGPVVHPQDGNVMAVLAGVGTTAQQRAALAYLGKADYRGYGNTIADDDVWDDPVWGYQAADRVYPFIGYFELVARFRLDLDDSGIDLLRREWGYMVRNGPGTMWETIGPFGGFPEHGSAAHGWSTGAAPALVEWVLGVRPTSPGYATFAVVPHTGDVGSASGDVQTPHGAIHVEWVHTGAHVTVRVTAPPGTRWQNAPKTGNTLVLTEP